MVYLLSIFKVSRNEYPETTGSWGLYQGWGTQQDPRTPGFGEDTHMLQSVTLRLLNCTSNRRHFTI